MAAAAATMGLAAPSTPPKPTLDYPDAMASLTPSEIEKLFSGAPQFFAFLENTGHVSAEPPHPLVAFPWDEDVGIRDLTDHTQIENPAWGGVTAWPHITRGLDPLQSHDAPKLPKRRPQYQPQGPERPCMLSMSGLEKGSIGFQAALELSVADALLDGQYGFETLTSGGRTQAIADQRRNLLGSVDGPRKLAGATILALLAKNTKRYRESARRGLIPEQAAIPGEPAVSTVERLYQELFTSILHPPHRMLNRKDPHGLATQISSLVKILAKSNVWVDLSRVEWRIRFGQLLWGSPAEPEAGDAGGAPAKTESPGAPASNNDLQHERYWLFLQILLACELLIRLDAVVECEGLGIGFHIRPSEFARFDRDVNASVKWSLYLARAWLENIDVAQMEVPAVDRLEAPQYDGVEPAREVAKLLTDERKATSGGWFSALVKRLSIASSAGDFQTEEAVGTAPQGKPGCPQTAYAIRGRHVQRQIEGLTHFATKLGWPDLETYASRLATADEESYDAFAGGSSLAGLGIVCSPTGMDGGAKKSGGAIAGSLSSFFQGAKPNNRKRRVPARRRSISAALSPTSWLSKSYVSGLMLPGEGMGHFLMATLIENDEEAMDRLGPMANLCGGFVFEGKSFWSSACIVGRVLAAAKGSAECMGWISSDVTPQGFQDCWINIDVEETIEDSQNIDKKARIWGKQTIERNSRVLGDVEPSSVLPADFMIPFENVYPEGKRPTPARVVLKSLQLSSTPADPSKTVPPFGDGKGASQPLKPVRLYSAAMTFIMADVESGKEREQTFKLSHDINFVTAHPCVSSQHTKIIRAPCSPTIQQVQVWGDHKDEHTGARRPGSVMGHPLHKVYTYTAIHLSELLARKDAPLEDLFGIPPGQAEDPSDHQITLEAKYCGESFRNSLPTSAQHRKIKASSLGPPPRVLVIDCITGFRPSPLEHEMPISPIIFRTEAPPPAPPRRRRSSAPPLDLTPVTSNTKATTTTANSVFSPPTTTTLAIAAAVVVETVPIITTPLDPPISWTDGISATAATTAPINAAAGPVTPTLPDTPAATPPEAALPVRTTSSSAPSSSFSSSSSSSSFPSAICTSPVSFSPPPSFISDSQQRHPSTQSLADAIERSAVARRSTHLPRQPDHRHPETRRRQFGSDMEMLVRALCAERGWNALISRRRRGCLACAIREAGALGWRVVMRVD